MIRHSARCRGFAMCAAIIVFGMVAVTIVSLSAAFSVQAGRAYSQSQDAQLRELLLAGAQAARARLDSQSAFPVTIPLPSSLSDQGATLLLTRQSPQSPDAAVIDIQASLPHHALAQRLQFSHASGTWQLIDAQLNP